MLMRARKVQELQAKLLALAYICFLQKAHGGTLYATAYAATRIILTSFNGSSAVSAC